MNHNQKHPFEDLADSQLDEIMGYDIPMTEINMENMYNRFEQERKAIRQRKPFKRLAAILVAVVAVALVGFTNADRIQRLFQMLLGGPVQLEQTDYSMIGESATDQGFRMDVLSAVRDSENLYLLVELTDIESDRLSDDLYIDHCIVDGISKNLGENVASMSGIKADLLEYDPARKTATLGIHATGNFITDEAVFSLNAIANGETKVNTYATELDLYAIVQNSSSAFQSFDSSNFDGVGISSHDISMRQNIEDIRECLTLDAIDVPIPGYDAEHITNLAYKDGMLYLQLKPLQMGIGNSVEISLQHIETGEKLKLRYTLMLGQYYVKTPKDAQVISNYYNERVYELDSLESLKDYVIYVEGVYYKNSYSGDWNVRFDAPKATASVELPILDPIAIDGKSIEIKKVTVTPLSVTILSKESVKDSFDVTLIYANGERKELTNSGMYTYESGDQEWHYTNAFHFQSISEVEINGTRFDFPHDLLK